MAISATNLRKGMVIQHENDLWIVVDTQHVKLSKGPAAMQTKLKNLKRGDHINYRFRSSESIDIAFLDKKVCEYLYQDGENYVFMDIETYEQHLLHSELVGELMGFVKLNSRVTVVFYEGQAISVDLPPSVVLEVIDTEPGHKGNTVTNVYKPATTETGLEVKVPMHIIVGNKVKVKTETGEFQERVND